MPLVFTKELCHDIKLPSLTPFKHGKVRTVYDLGDETLALVATDRISAFDHVLPTPIPQKGAVLTQLSTFWFHHLHHSQFPVPTHLITDQWSNMPAILNPYQSQLEGRVVHVKKTTLIPVECVVRGYIIGSGWAEYQQTGSVCGVSLPPHLSLADALPEPIFTPAAKADIGGHDENITFEAMCDLIGQDLAIQMRQASIALFQLASKYVKARGIILADTKFEFGLHAGKLMLIDEILTPDSSRYWPAVHYSPGQSPPSFDKQILRDYLRDHWNQSLPVPELPPSLVAQISDRYQHLYHSLTAPPQSIQN
jgi:phosphoribosylaminoimidazole-succinocarboxamide synthase